MWDRAFSAPPLSGFALLSPAAKTAYLPPLINKDGWADMSDLSQTNTTVASAATSQNRINLDATALIGVIGPSAAQEALIRFPEGHVVKVRAGAKVKGLGYIAAIRDDQVVLSDGGATKILRVLGG